MMKRLLLILALLAIPAFASGPPNFTILSLPDLQFMSDYCQSTQLPGIVSWISANKTTLNILAVVGEGDSWDTPDTAQITCFNTYFVAPLLALGIPVIITPGNHDYDPVLPIVNGQISFPAGRSLTLWTTNILTPIQAQSAYQANWTPGATGLSTVAPIAWGSGQTPGAYNVIGSCSGVTGCSCSTLPVISVTVGSGGTVSQYNLPTVTTAGSCTGTVSPTFALTGTGGTAATFQGALLGAEAPAAYWIKINDGGYPFGLISTGYCPLAGETAWEQGVMAANNFPFFAVTHAAVYSAGTTQATPVGTLSTLTSPATLSCNASNFGSNTQVYDPTAQSGVMIWSALQSSANLFFQINGHFTTNTPPAFTAHIDEVGTNGNDVPHEFFNHQEDTYYGWVRILQVQPTAGQILVSTYNPFLASYLTDPQNQFTEPYNIPYTSGSTSNVGMSGSAVMSGNAVIQ